MIRVMLAPEPASFTKKVRRPGENALAVLAGNSPPHKRPGPKPLATKIVGGVIVPRTVDDFPYWRDCLDDLYEAYGGMCAYYCFWIAKATLPQVDHFLAKTNGRPDLAYEWRNYRLACGYANMLKNEHPDVLDPMSIEDGWFRIELDTLRVVPDPGLSKKKSESVEKTIARLKLSKGRALEVRDRAMNQFRAGYVLIDFLKHDHPFLAKELLRQGVRKKEDLPELPPFVLSTIEPELRKTRSTRS